MECSIRIHRSALIRVTSCTAVMCPYSLSSSAARLNCGCGGGGTLAVAVAGEGPGEGGGTPVATAAPKAVPGTAPVRPPVPCAPVAAPVPAPVPVPCVSDAASLSVTSLIRHWFSVVASSRRRVPFGAASHGSRTPHTAGTNARTSAFANSANSMIQAKASWCHGTTHPHNGAVGTRSRMDCVCFTTHTHAQAHAR